MSIHGQFITVRQSELESYLNDSFPLLERLETIANTDPALFHVHKSWDAISYGPPCYLTDDQVKAVHAALSNISIANFKEKYDTNSMNAAKVYPGQWIDDDKSKNYVVDYFEELKTFYEKAARNNSSVICYLS